MTTAEHLRRGITTTEVERIEAIKLLSRLASLVERMADITPDDRDKFAAREIAAEAGRLAKRFYL